MMGNTGHKNRYESAQQVLARCRNYLLVAAKSPQSLDQTADFLSSIGAADVDLTAVKSLQAFGEELGCYVPSMLRAVELQNILTMSLEDVVRAYDISSWATDDLIVLMEQLAVQIDPSSRELLKSAAQQSVEQSHRIVAAASGNNGIQSVAAGSRKVPDSASLLHVNETRVESAQEVETHVGEANSLKIAQPASANPNDSVDWATLRATFESLRQLLVTDFAHPVLQEETREFVEPGDTDLPFEYLAYSVCDVLETPFDRLAQRWVGHRELVCLLRLLERAAASVRLLTGRSDEECATVEISLRPRPTPVPRELDYDGKAWFAWCDVINKHDAAKHWLGTVAESLRDIPSTLWCRPLADFTTVTLRGLAELPTVGQKRLELVVDIVRSFALDLSSIQLGTNLSMKLFPGPLRGVSEWFDDVLVSRRIPNVEEITVRLVRPLTWQLQRDLPEREADIAIHRLRPDQLANSEKPEDVDEEYVRAVNHWVRSGGEGKTLAELSGEHKISRERVRQLEAWGPKVLQVRFPQARYLLEALHELLLYNSGTREQLRLVRMVAGRWFDWPLEASVSQSEALEAWEQAGQQRQTPMDDVELSAWVAQRLPRLVPKTVKDWIAESAPRHRTRNGRQLYFSSQPLDQLLHKLLEGQSPVTKEEATNIVGGDERSVVGRLVRDARFVLLDDGRVEAAERCSLRRIGGVWHIGLTKEVADTAQNASQKPSWNGLDALARKIFLLPEPNHSEPSAPLCEPTWVSVETLGRMIGSGLLQLGIADATAWGVHRFAGELVAKMYGAELPPAFTPFVLCDLLVKVTVNFMRPMRRRRLHWDSPHTGIPARGKGGWVAEVVSRNGCPIVLDELGDLLRKNYQDYASHVINQIQIAADEGGGFDDRVQYLAGIAHRVPPILVPKGWQFDLPQRNVSEGVLAVARRLARMRRRNSGFDLAAFAAMPWLIELVSAFENSDSQSDQDEPDDDWVSPTDTDAVAEPVVASAPSLDVRGEIQIAYWFGRILKGMPKDRPWSLVEIALSEDDFELLKVACEQLTAPSIRSILDSPNRLAGYSRETQVGAVLLLVEAETARRHASEGTLWAAIYRQISWREDTAKFLFNQGQPNSRHRAMLEAAARELDLRRAFGEDSAQEWYQSVFLQFGFSKKGFEKRLPEWLAGQNLPRSVDRLLNDSRYSSPTFAKLWEALHDFRQGAVERAYLESALAVSPWVLPEWHESIISLSRSPISETGRGTISADEASADSSNPSEGRSQGGFLVPPELRLENGVLEFVCRVELPPELELTEDSYDVTVAGQSLARILQQSDGSYLVTPEEIAVSSDSGTIVAQLRDRHGVVVATQIVTLWDPNEDVDAYVLRSGRRISPWSRDFAEKGTLLIYASDLRIEPARLTRGSVGNGSRHVALLSSKDAVTARLFLGDELLWTPNTRVVPAWSERVCFDTQFQPRESPTHFRIRIFHPSDVVVASIRCRGQILECQSTSQTGAQTELLPLDETHWDSEEIRFTVLLRKDDERADLRYRTPLRLGGHLWRRGEKWELLPSSLACDIDEFRNARIRLSPPESIIKGVGWHLFEGQRWIAPVDQRSQRISDLDGWGAPLTLRTGPYNSCQDEQHLIRGLTNHGIIQDVEFRDDGGVSVHLRRAIAPDSSHALVLLGYEGQFIQIPAPDLACLQLDSNGSIPSWDLPSTAIELIGSRPASVAIAYDGSWLGSWWADDWSRVLSPRSETDGRAVNVGETDLAQALRWFHLPLLSPDNAASVREFAFAFPVTVLTAWLSSKSSDRLVQSTAGEAWASVARSIFADWQPKESDAVQLEGYLESALSDGNEIRLKAATVALTVVSPILAARFLRVRLRELRSNDANARDVKALPAILRQEFLKRQSENDLIQSVAQDVARSDKPEDGTLDFVRDGLLAKALLLFDQGPQGISEERDRRNVEIAMRLDAFRTLVLVKCLDRIKKELA